MCTLIHTSKVSRSELHSFSQIVATNYLNLSEHSFLCHTHAHIHTSASFYLHDELLSNDDECASSSINVVKMQTVNATRMIMHVVVRKGKREKIVKSFERKIQTEKDIIELSELPTATTITIAAAARAKTSTESFVVSKCMQCSSR